MKEDSEGLIDLFNVTMLGKYESRQAWHYLVLSLTNGSPSSIKIFRYFFATPHDGLLIDARTVNTGTIVCNRYYLLSYDRAINKLRPRTTVSQRVQPHDVSDMSEAVRNSNILVKWAYKLQPITSSC